MARLSPLQRGYLMGFRRARAQARRERDELADRFEETLGKIHAEMRDLRNEMVRSRMLDSAIRARAWDVAELNAGCRDA